MSTGVRILPFDTIGYMFDGVMGSYQLVRKCQEFFAKTYPQCAAQIAEDARALNRTHLRRLLSAAVRNKIGMDGDDRLHRWWLENLPRCDRKPWGDRLAPKPKSKFAASREFVTSVQQAHQRPLTDILRGFVRPPIK